MNKKQAKRLLNVAKALREGVPEEFSMYGYGECGTPMCALGHYADRKDLQKTFKLKRNGGLALAKKRGYKVSYASIEIQDHFGLDWDGALELFATSGCDYARNNVAAAKYIEQFVKAQQS